MKSLVPKNNGVLKGGFNRVIFDFVRRYTDTDDGRAGSIKQAGGVFKQMGTAKEAQFFHKKERELIENLRESMKEQIEFHEEQIAIHQKAIDKIRKKQKDMK